MNIVARQSKVAVLSKANTDNPVCAIIEKFEE